MIGAFGTVTRGSVKCLENLVFGRGVNYGIIENGQNTEKSPGDLRATCFHSNSSGKLK